MIETSAAGASRRVSTNQTTVHHELVAAVIKHRREPYRRPLGAHAQVTFEKLDAAVRRAGTPVILDSGCGTGESAVTLAQNHPDHFVVGIDKSAARVARQRRTQPDNLVLERSDCVDIWRLASKHGWRIAKHYVLYPNPWPKSRHLYRRWHGHPVFGALIDLGGALELRSNWRIYVEEFALALATLEVSGGSIDRLYPESALTPFERKYVASGHALYRLQVQLPPPNAARQ